MVLSGGYAISLRKKGIPISGNKGTSTSFKPHSPPSTFPESESALVSTTLACKRALYGDNARVARPRVTASGASARATRGLQIEPARGLPQRKYSLKTSSKQDLAHLAFVPAPVLRCLFNVMAKHLSPGGHCVVVT